MRGEAEPGERGEGCGSERGGRSGGGAWMGGELLSEGRVDRVGRYLGWGAQV